MLSVSKKTEFLKACFFFFALNVVPCWGNTSKWRTHPLYLLQELHDCTHCSWEQRSKYIEKNPPASSPLPLPNPAHLVFNIYKGSLFPFPTTWNLEFSSKDEQGMNLAHPLIAGPSASSFAKACFQVQSLSTVPQWINLIKEEDRSQLLVPKPLSSYATASPPAHSHGHNMKKTALKFYCFRPTIIFEPRQLFRDERGNEAAELLSCHDRSMHTSWLLPMASPTLWNSEKKGKKKKKAQLMRIAVLFMPQ